MTPSPICIRRVLSGSLLAFLLCTVSAQAGERRFTYSYDATTLAAGEVEFEQWVTWKTDKKSNSSFNQFNFREEIEFGITDKLQGGFYFSNWRTQHSQGDTDTTWQSTAFELIYNLTDPTTDILGSALYGEVTYGPQIFKLEGKILLQKNVGPWEFIYNGVVEGKWEGSDYNEVVGELQQTAGASYQFSPSWSLGAELLWEIEGDSWSNWNSANLYAGPNASFRTTDWYLTITPMAQLTSNDGEVDYQVRMIFGLDF